MYRLCRVDRKHAIDQLEFEWVGDVAPPGEAAPRAGDASEAAAPRHGVAAGLQPVGEARPVPEPAERPSRGNGSSRGAGGERLDPPGQAEPLRDPTHAERQARSGRSAQAPDGDGRRSEGAKQRAAEIEGKAERLWKALQDRTGQPIHLTVTNNSSSLMSMRHVRNGGLVKLRLHHMFVEADACVVRALGTWINQPKRKSSAEVLNRYIRENMHLVREKPPRRDRLRVRGRHHNLRELYEEVNQAHFSGQITARIGWGRASTVRRQRSIRFGSYWAQDNLIRIHPALDRACVPRYFVRYIVFHEMLHAHLGIEETPTGRRRVHTKAFREAEEAYFEYERAVAWQNKPGNMRRLLR